MKLLQWQRSENSKITKKEKHFPSKRLSDFLVFHCSSAFATFFVCILFFFACSNSFAMKSFKSELRQIQQHLHSLPQQMKTFANNPVSNIYVMIHLCNGVTSQYETKREERKTMGEKKRKTIEFFISSIFSCSAHQIPLKHWIVELNPFARESCNQSWKKSFTKKLYFIWTGKS